MTPRIDRLPAEQSAGSGAETGHPPGSRAAERDSDTQAGEPVTGWCPHCLHTAYLDADGRCIPCREEVSK